MVEAAPIGAAATVVTGAVATGVVTGVVITGGATAPIGVAITAATGMMANGLNAHGGYLASTVTKLKGTQSERIIMGHA